MTARADVGGPAAGPAAQRAGGDTTTEVIPLAQPVLGPEEEAAVIEVLRSGQLSLGPRVPAFEQAFAAWVGAAHASAVSSGTAGLHLALRAVGVADGDEVVTSPFSFVASANAVLFERARPVFADIDPRTLNLDPDAAAAAVTERTDRAAAGAHLRLPGRPARLRGAWACRSSRTPARRSAPCTPTARAVGARGHPAVFGFYANKQLTTGEGGMVTVADAAIKERIDSERNQGRAPDMGWLDHDRLGFNYRLTDVACAIGSVQLERLDGMLADRARVAGCLPRGAGAASRGSGCRARTPAATGAAGSCSSCRCRAGATATTVIRALRERGVQCKPYLPAIHLMSFYRERFGHREGEFPVCEDVAARSVALPFFPDMTEGQVAAGGRGAGGGGRPGSIIGLMASLRADAERARRRRARRIGAVGFVGAVALPIVLWHRVIADIASEFHLDAQYLITGWSPWVLMALGLLCFVPVVVEDWRDRDRRFHHPGTGAWLGWGITLYLLGFALATQVAQIADGLSAA